MDLWLVPLLAVAGGVGVRAICQRVFYCCGSGSRAGGPGFGLYQIRRRRKEVSGSSDSAIAVAVILPLERVSRGNFTVLLHPFHSSDTHMSLLRIKVDA